MLPRNALHSLTARRHQRSTTRECSCADQSSHHKNVVYNVDMRYIINEFIVCEMRISLGVSGWRRTRTQWRVTAERCRWVIKAWSKKYSHWHSYTIPLYSYQVLNSIRSMPPWEEGDATFLPLTYWMFEKRFKRKAIACYTWSMKGILYNISIKYVRCSKRRPRQSNAGWSWLYT